MKVQGEGHVIGQAAGGVVADVVAARVAHGAAELSRQDAALEGALECLGRVRGFVGTPGHILGSDATKHGEIAEQVEVGVRNARDCLVGRTFSSTFDGVGRTAPADYLIDGVEVQSKFVNGVSRNLDHVLDHMRKYAEFGRDESFYQIPRDHHEAIRRVLAGESVEGLGEKTARAIREKSAEITRLSGKADFHEVVRPGVSSYPEVQKGRIHQTLDEHERGLRTDSDGIKRQIHEEHQASLQEGLGAAAKGAAVGAAVRFTAAIYEKHRQGKRLFAGDYTVADWKDLGVEAVVGGAQGGISAAGIYALTQYADLAAPFAAGAVSTALVVAQLVNRYRQGELTFEEFVELGQLTCVEGACVGLASALGQTIVPVPVLGALLGAVAGRWLLSFGKDSLEADAARLKAHLEAAYRDRLRVLDGRLQAQLTQLLAEYDRLTDLTRAAFDLDSNVALRTQASIELARAWGVPEQHIIHNLEELDAFMLG